MFSASLREGQVTTSSSDDPATFSCRLAFSVPDPEVEVDEVVEVEVRLGSLEVKTVWMDWTWLKSAMWVAW